MNKVTNKVIYDSYERFGVQLREIWCPVTRDLVSSYERFGVCYELFGVIILQVF